MKDLHMRWTWLSASAALVALAGMPSPASAQDIQDALVKEGLAIAKDKCGRCHALGEKDVSPHDKAPPFRLVAERYPSENIAEALAEGIVSGHPDMPVFVFEPDQIEAFLAYLDSLAPTERSAPGTGAPAAGSTPPAQPAPAQPK